MGTALGRYREDTYDGTQGIPTGTLGNPWFLTTLAISELYFQTAIEMSRAGSITITGISAPFFQQIGLLSTIAVENKKYLKGSAEFKAIVTSLIKNADEIIRRVAYHVGPSGNMAEQFSRFNGFQTSAENLTWSYSSVLTVNYYRNIAMKQVE